MKRLLIGSQGKTSKGTFKVLRATPTNYIVVYTSGEWKGKYLLMPKEPVTKHKIETWKTTKAEMNAFLDLFHKMFRQEYNQVWLSERYREGDTPYAKNMFESLKEEWAPLFQLAMQEYFTKRP